MAQSQNDSRSRVPLELIEHILDNLREDRASLEASSLVSRTWIPRARRHFFGEVTFSCDKNRPGPARYTSSKMISFMQLCTDTHSTIPAAGIRTIEIDGEISRQLLNTFLQWLCSPAPSSNDVKSARTMADYVLWNVDHLKYYHAFRDHAWALFAEIPKSTSFRRVRALTLSEARLDVIEEYYRLIQAFECLEFLNLQRVSLKHFRQGDSPIFPTLPKTFRGLNVHSSFLWPFVHFRNLQTLRELSIHLVTPFLDPVLREFLTGSASVMNGALKLCTIHFDWSLKPSGHLALERTIAASKIPGWTFKGSIEEVGHFLDGISELDSPLKDPSAANKVASLILDIGGYNGYKRETIKSRIQSLDRMVESYALFDSLKEVGITMRGSFLEEDLLEAGWSPAAADWVRPESKPRIEMEEGVKELKQLAPCCTRRGVVRTLIVYDDRGVPG